MWMLSIKYHNKYFICINQLNSRDNLYYLDIDSILQIR